jgi:hypothetical protein
MPAPANTSKEPMHPVSSSENLPRNQDIGNSRGFGRFNSCGPRVLVLVTYKNIRHFLEDCDLSCDPAVLCTRKCGPSPKRGSPVSPESVLSSSTLYAMTRPQDLPGQETPSDNRLVAWACLWSAPTLRNLPSTRSAFLRSATAARPYWRARRGVILPAGRVRAAPMPYRAELGTPASA